MNHELYLEQVQNFSKNLKHLRRKRGLTLAELSEKLNIPKGTVSIYETGYNLCSVDRMKQIAEFYGLDSYTDLLMNHEEFTRKA